MKDNDPILNSFTARPTQTKAAPLIERLREAESRIGVLERELGEAFKRIVALEKECGVWTDDNDRF